jgi:hypothetical protein
MFAAVIIIVITTNLLCRMPVGHVVHESMKIARNEVSVV